jgi:adenylate cyclase
MKKQFDEALAEGETAVSMCPNCAENKVLLGHILRFMGKPEEAIQVLKQAIRLNPFPTVMAYHNLAMSYVFAGMPDEALETFKKALKIEPNNFPANLGLAVAYASLGREEDARAVGAKILEINPKFSIKAFAKRLSYKDEAYRTLLIDGVLKAGLPEQWLSDITMDNHVS